MTASGDGNVSGLLDPDSSELSPFLGTEANPRSDSIVSNADASGGNSNDFSIRGEVLV
jgi:hypothetical protein